MITVLRRNPIPILVDRFPTTATVMTLDLLDIEEEYRERLREHIVKSILLTQDVNGGWSNSIYETLWNLDTLINLKYRGKEVNLGVGFVLRKVREDKKSSFPFRDKTQKVRTFGGKEFRLNPFNLTCYAVEVLSRMNARDKLLRDSIEAIVEESSKINLVHPALEKVLWIIRALSQANRTDILEDFIYGRIKNYKSSSGWKVRPYSNSNEDLFFATHSLLYVIGNKYISDILKDTIDIILRKQSNNGLWGRRNQDEKTYIAIKALIATGVITKDDFKDFFHFKNR